MSTARPKGPDGCDGSPLAVCINDCQLDYGQPSSELVRICFSVHCAFAEMRWGRSAALRFGVAQPTSDENTTKQTTIDSR
jgi:hypothetical protein